VCSSSHRGAAWYGLDSWHAVFATNLFSVANVQSVFVPRCAFLFVLAFSFLCRLFVFRFIRFGPVIVMPTGLCSRPSRASPYPSAALPRCSRHHEPSHLHCMIAPVSSTRDHHNSHDITCRLTPAPRSCSPPCPSRFSTRSFGFDHSTTRNPHQINNKPDKCTRELGQSNDILGACRFYTSICCGLSLLLLLFLTPRASVHLRYAPSGSSTLLAAPHPLAWTEDSSHAVRGCTCVIQSFFYSSSSSHLTGLVRPVSARSVTSCNFHDALS
jgi:hypothetical protein